MPGRAGEKDDAAETAKAPGANLTGRVFIPTSPESCYELPLETMASRGRSQEIPARGTSPCECKAGSGFFRRFRGIVLPTGRLRDQPYCPNEKGIQP